MSLLRDVTEEESKESSRSPRYTQEDLRVWWNNGQTRLSTIRPYQKHILYRDDGFVVSLPENFYRPYFVVLPNSDKPLTRISMQDAFFQLSDPSYYVYEGKLHLTGIDASIKEFVLLYAAYHSPVKDDESVLTIPVWAEEAVSYYVAMSAVTQEMMRDARYRKFISKNDAGNPQQSPFIPVAKWLRERYYEIINTHTDDDEDSQWKSH